MEVDKRFIEVEHRFTQIDQQLVQMQTEMRQHSDLLRAEMRASHSAIKEEIASSKTSIIMWVVTTVFVALVLPFIRDFRQITTERQPPPAHVTPPSGQPVPREPPLPASEN